MFIVILFAILPFFRQWGVGKAVWQDMEKLVAICFKILSQTSKVNEEMSEKHHSGDTVSTSLLNSEQCNNQQKATFCTSSTILWMRKR